MMIGDLPFLKKEVPQIPSQGTQTTQDNRNEPDFPSPIKEELLDHNLHHLIDTRWLLKALPYHSHLVLLVLKTC